MNEKKFAFIILHYNELNVTKKCIDAIKKNTDKHAVAIVIVDNCSPDGSGKALKEIYKTDVQVTVLQTEKNCGFAKGNNLGYRYAKDILHVDFMCVMNNDVLLLQPDFIDRIYEEYDSERVGIIGPHITLLNGMTNYMYLKMHKQSFYENELKNAKMMYRYYTSRLYPVRNIINRTLDKLLPALKFQKQPVKETLDDKIQMVVASKQRHKNIVLHGCCLILTPLYIGKFDTAFDDRTFMFREEELLYLRCRKHEIETVYEPSIDILHLEDMSTNATFKKDCKREAFKNKCQIDSLQILLEELR